MARTLLQLLGILVILVSVGGWWLLDRYGCGFNTSGCKGILPRLTLDVVMALSVPVGIGLLLIVLGRRR